MNLFFACHILTVNAIKALKSDWISFPFEKLKKLTKSCRKKLMYAKSTVIKYIKRISWVRVEVN